MITNVDECLFVRVNKPKGISLNLRQIYFRFAAQKWEIRLSLYSSCAKYFFSKLPNKNKITPVSPLWSVKLLFVFQQSALIIRSCYENYENSLYFILSYLANF